MYKYSIYSMVVLMFCSTSGVCDTSSDVIIIDTLPGILWERTLGDKDNIYQNEVVAFRPTSKNLIVAGESSIDKNNSIIKDGIWIWNINNLGNKVVDIKISTVNLGRSYVIIERLQSMLVVDDSTVLLTAISNTNATIFAKINLNGDVLFSRSIGSNKLVRKIVKLSDNNFLLLGSLNAHPFAMKVDSSGKELWNKEYDRGQYGIFSDGIPTNYGGFLLVENVGNTNDFTTNTPNIFISRYNENGVKLNERYLAGRFGKLTTGLNGVLALIYDKSLTSAQNIWVQAYDVSLTPLWNSNIINTDYGVEEFKISSINNGDYIIAGLMGSNLKTYVSYIDSSGKQKWSYISKVSDYGIGTDIVCSDATCYLLKSIPTLQTVDSEIRKIQIIKFKP